MVYSLSAVLWVTLLLSLYFFLAVLAISWIPSGFARARKLLYPRKVRKSF